MSRLSAAVEPTVPTEVRADPSPPPVRGELWDALGGVRFGLAAIVVAVHVQDFPLHTPVATALQRLGAFPAVMAFFVISGYSIGHSITRRPQGYLVRRVRRIYPLYALAVLASLVPPAIEGTIDAHLLKIVAYNMVFGESFRTISTPGNMVVWTLAVEVAFYALAPVLVRLPTWGLMGLTAASAVAFAVYPHTGLAYYGKLIHGLPMLFLGWAWLAGFTYQRVQHARAAGPLLMGFVILLFDLNPTYLYPLSRVTMAACLAVLITGRAWRLPSPVRRVLAFGGDLSYPLYLFHAPFLASYERVGGQSQLLALALSFPIAGAMLVVDVLIRRATAGAVVARWARWVAPRTAGRLLGPA